MKREEHPLTPLLVAEDGYVAKVRVEKMSGAIRSLRPRWRARWGCWFVEDAGPQEIELSGRAYPKFKVK